VPHGRGLLAAGAELWPQLDDQCIVVEDATLGEHVDHRRGHTLAYRVAKKRRVRRNRTSGCRVGGASDGVDYRLAMPVHGDLQAPLGSILDQPVDLFLNLLLGTVHKRFPSQWCLEPSDIPSDFRQIVVELMPSTIELVNGCLREFHCVQREVCKAHPFVITAMVK
jgi:hypothetical protein